MSRTPTCLQTLRDAKRGTPCPPGEQDGAAGSRPAPARADLQWVSRLSAHPLSSAQKADFQDDGFLVVRGLAAPSLVNSLRLAVIKEVLGRKGELELEAEVAYPGAPERPEAVGGGTIRRLLQAYDRGELFQRWATSPPLKSILRQLLGEEVVLSRSHHNCIMTKHPRYSSQTQWHQDIRYWSFKSPQLISVWLALGPESPRNGALSFIPGSHRLEDLDDTRMDAARFLRPEVQKNAELIKTERQMTLRPGDVVFFHARTLHAAGRNLTDRAKYALVFTFHGASNGPLAATRSARLSGIPM